MKQHKHAETIKAWADGAEIQGYDKQDKKWCNVHNIMWGDSTDYRISPDCEYAFNKIEWYGDEQLKAYKAFLAGKYIQISETITCLNLINKKLSYSDFSFVGEKPFEWFIEMLKSGKNFRLKKGKIKQVLWVKPYDNTSSHSLWLDENHVQKDDNWHKVPTCTREVDI